jgi:PD-(D/E)XK nuclease superfamily
MTNLPIPADVDAIAREIVDAAIKVHRTLGPGLLESSTSNALCTS